MNLEVTFGRFFKGSMKSSNGKGALPNSRRRLYQLTGANLVYPINNYISFGFHLLDQFFSFTMSHAATKYVHY